MENIYGKQQQSTYMLTKKKPLTEYYMRGISTKVKKVAYIINKYFKQKIETIKNDLPNPTCDPMKSYMQHIKTPKKLLSFQTINIGQVLNIISSLNNSNSCAKDGVSSKIIKMIKEAINPLILHIINRVIKQKKFPNYLKTTKILPTWKTNSNNMS